MESEETFTQSSIKLPNNSLISVKGHIPSSYLHIMLCQLSWHHPWIHAQDQPEELWAISVVHAHRLSEKPLRPQKILLRWLIRFSSLESACNINNSQCIPVEFPQPCSHFVMREEKKFSLASCIWRFDIKSLSQDMLQGWRINLPDGLLHQPKLCNLLRHSGFFSQLLTAGNPFQKP